jgi:hypothetical protein
MEGNMLKQDDYIKGRLVEMGWRFCQSYVGAGHIAGQMIMHCLANRVRNGSVPDMVKGAQYWGDLAKIEQPWFLEKIIQATKLDQNECLVPAHERVANTNGLNFWL